MSSIKYARVKDIKSGKFSTVEVDDIHHFKMPFERQKLYNLISSKEKVAISMVGESIEDINEKIKKCRQKTFAINKMKSASEFTEEEESPLTLKKANSMSSEKWQAALDQQMQALVNRRLKGKRNPLSSLNVEISTCTPSNGVREKKVPGGDVPCPDNDKENQNIGGKGSNMCEAKHKDESRKRKSSNDEIMEHELPIKRLVAEHSQCSSAQPTHDNGNKIITVANVHTESLHSVNEDSDSLQSTMLQDSSDLVSNYELYELAEIEHTKKDTLSGTPSSHQVLSEISTISKLQTSVNENVIKEKESNDRNTRTRSRNVPVCEKLGKLKSKKKSKSKPRSRNEVDQSQLFLEVDRIEDQLTKLKDLVCYLQETIGQQLSILIENWEEMRATSTTDLELQSKPFVSCPPPGYWKIQNETEVLHIGQGLWVLKDDYDEQALRACSVSAFVRNMGPIIFGPDMHNKTVTGSKAPRTGEIKEALPVNKIMATRDIYDYYLRSFKKWKDDEAIADELDLVEEYLREKIVDMKKKECVPTNKMKDNNKKPTLKKKTESRLAKKQPKRRKTAIKRRQPVEVDNKKSPTVSETSSSDSEVEEELTTNEDSEEHMSENN